MKNLAIILRQFNYSKRVIELVPGQTSSRRGNVESHHPSSRSRWPRTSRSGCSRALFLSFLKWVIPGLSFFYFRLFKTIQLIENKCSIKFPVSGSELWYRKRPLCQLSHNNCPLLLILKSLSAASMNRLGDLMSFGHRFKECRCYFLAQIAEIFGNVFGNCQNLTLSKNFFRYWPWVTFN